MAKKPKAVKTGKTEMVDGATICEYSDGSYRYLGDAGKTKGALARKPDWLVSFTPETAIEAIDIKRSKKQEDFAIALQRAADGISPRPVPTDREGVQFMLEKQAELGMSPDVKGSTGAAKLILDGYYINEPKKGPGVLHIHLDNATINARAQTRRMVEEFEADTIEGEYVEG